MGNLQLTQLASERLERIGPILISVDEQGSDLGAQFRPFEVVGPGEGALGEALLADLAAIALLFFGMYYDVINNVTGEEVSTREIKKILSDCIENEEKRKNKQIKIVAVGGCAISEGPLEGEGNIEADMYIPGCPPRPESLLDGLIKLKKEAINK